MLYSRALVMEAPMVDEAGPAEYDIRQDEAGWTVFDVATDAPASVNGLPQTGLRMDAAIRMADLLTTLEEDDAD